MPEGMPVGAGELGDGKHWMSRAELMAQTAEPSTAAGPTPMHAEPSPISGASQTHRYASSISAQLAVVMHASPHAPQCSSASSVCSQPLLSISSQSWKSPLHAPSWQAPSEHTPAALSKTH